MSKASYHVGLTDDCPLDVAYVGGVALCKRTYRVTPRGSKRAEFEPQPGLRMTMTDDQAKALVAAIARVGVRVREVTTASGTIKRSAKLVRLAGQLRPLATDLAPIGLDAESRGLELAERPDVKLEEANLDPDERRALAAVRRARRAQALDEGDATAVPLSTWAYVTAKAPEQIVAGVTLASRPQESAKPAPTQRPANAGR